MSRLTLRTLVDKHGRTYRINSQQIAIYRMDESNSFVVLWLAGISEPWNIHTSLEEFETALFGEII